MNRTKKLVYIAIFAAIATILMRLETPVLFLPPFLKLDLSGLPAVLAGFMFGPLAGVSTILVKDLINLFFTTSAGVGELADFLVLSSFVLCSSLIYKHKKTRATALIGCAFGIAAMTIVGSLANKFLLIPFYQKLMPLEAIIEACQKVNPSITSIDTYIIFGVLPFNILKGVILSLITILIYKKLSNFIRG